MYENGKRVNGYQKKRLHKRKVKNSYAKIYCYGDGEYTWRMLVTEFKDEPRMKWGHPLDYWKNYSLTEQRSMAKEQTNRALRREFNNFKNKIVLEEIEDLGMQAGGYYETFSNCRSLHTIAVVRTQAETTWKSAFANCSALENLTIEGTIGQDGFSVRYSTKLSKASLLSILNACNIDVSESPVTIILPNYCIDGQTSTSDLIINGGDTELTEACTAAINKGYSFSFA